jgi:DNA helicase-2/ATP-dependent DNA helicase PcrA
MSKPVLNSQQQAAVEALDGPVLVLAGAGSGKTRILTQRIAALIETGRAFPGEILAVTFTNKAAGEMKERVARLVEGQGIREHDLWIATFHSMGARLLRQHGHLIGLQPGFTIFDDSDQMALIKDAMERVGVSDKVVSPKSVAYRLDQLKNEGIDPRTYEPESKSFYESKLLPILRAYEEGLRQNNAVDFGDLLLRTVELFERNESLCDDFQDRYRYLLVDEYQDTNRVQYKLVRLLSRKYRNLCVVGDEDQSIYKWRGADIRNILDFEKDFPECRVVKLEQNYRSTGNIIRAANRVIANNTQRKEKNLFTDNEDGADVEVHHLTNDLDESRLVGRMIKTHVDQGVALKEIAIFYRTHAQSRLFEDTLRYERIPYRIYGGLKFYDRAEVKDSLAYLRVIVNPRDDVSLWRIINVPARGIGKTTIDALKAFAARERVSGLEAAGMAVKGELPELGTGPRKKIGAFLDIYAKLQAKRPESTALDFFTLLLDETGYVRELEKENTIESSARLENLKELGTAIADYENRTPDSTLEGFIEEIALMTDYDRKTDADHSVTLMTVHSAKGLEFPVVFLVGMEEELFPSKKRDGSGEDVDSIEEERRLCYVGMTRARQHLYMTTAKMRRVFGVTHVRQPSRFIDEMPAEGVKHIDHAPRAVEGAALGFRRARGDFDDFGGSFGDSSDSFGGAFEAPATDSFGVGVKVKHPDYGEGAVVKREGWGESLKLSIRFNSVGVKKFLAKFAPLEVLA